MNKYSVSVESFEIAFSIVSKEEANSSNSYKIKDFSL